MNKPLILTLAVSAVLGLSAAACTDVERAQTFNYGQEARITCYSGGQLRFDDFSTGRVTHEDGGQYSFVSQSTKRVTSVTGDCTLDYGAAPHANWRPVREPEFRSP